MTTLTFGQYTILMATRHGMTLAQLTEQTNFDRTLLYFFVSELLHRNLLAVSRDTNSESVYYKQTDKSFASIEEYERQNPALVISNPGC